MKELSAILELLRTVRTERQRAVLATVIQVQGSSYCRSGARMLIAENGRAAGAVSGGCVESDLHDLAKKVLASDVPRRVTYDSTAEADVLLGLGLGCGGVMDLLLEPFDPAESNVLEVLATAVNNRKQCALATVIAAGSGKAVTLAERLLADGSGTLWSNVRHPGLRSLLEEACRDTLAGSTLGPLGTTIGADTIAVIVELLSLPVSLVIFGAGASSVPLAHLAAELGWHVTVVDSRAAFLTTERFPTVRSLLKVQPEDVAATPTMTIHDAAVVMTHNFNHDTTILQALLPSPIRYVGLLGPRSRCERMIRELVARGTPPTGDQLARLHAPIGLDIGAETAEEIALAILAEIQGYHVGRSGGFLRDRKGPIH